MNEAPETVNALPAEDGIDLVTSADIIRVTQLPIIEEQLRSVKA